MMARTLLGRSALGLGIYSLCVVFVFSFLLFEVLDVDGSDFPVSATQDVDFGRDMIVPPVAPFLGEPLMIVAPPSVIVRSAPVVVVVPARHHRALARVSLDVPPAA
jgi:hypothetical protein